MKNRTGLYLLVLIILWLVAYSMICSIIRDKNIIDKIQSIQLKLDSSTCQNKLKHLIIKEK